MKNLLKDTVSVVSLFAAGAAWLVLGHAAEGQTVGRATLNMPMFQDMYHARKAGLEHNHESVSKLRQWSGIREDGSAQCYLFTDELNRFSILCQIAAGGVIGVINGVHWHEDKPLSLGDNG